MSIIIFSKRALIAKALANINQNHFLKNLLYLVIFDKYIIFQRAFLEVIN